MKCYKTLMYVTIWGLTQWDLDNLDRIMLNPEHPWHPDFINDALVGSVIFPSDNEVNYYLYGYLCPIIAAELRFDQNY